MPEKRKKIPTRASLTGRIKDVEKTLLGLAEHVDRLQDQQLLQHVELTALKQLLVEGRPITAESFNKRCNTIYASIVAGVKNDEQPLSEGQSEGRESGGETVVDATHDVPVGEA